MSQQSTTLIERFNKQGITLLVRPRKSLELLRVYKNEINQTNVLRSQGRIEDFVVPIQGHNIQFNRPTPNVDDTPTAKESGTLLHKRNISIAIDFLKGVFEPILTKLGIDISAKINANKVYAATFTLSSFHSEEIDNAALENILEGYKIRDDKSPQFANVRLYVNTGVYYCDKLEITVAELDSAEFSSLTSAELVQAGIKVTSERQGYNQIKYDERVAFGARFAWLDFSIYRDLPIKVNDVPSDEGLIVLAPGEPEILPFVYNIEEN